MRRNLLGWHVECRSEIIGFQQEDGKGKVSFWSLKIASSIEQYASCKLQRYSMIFTFHVHALQQAPNKVSIHNTYVQRDHDRLLKLVPRHLWRQCIPKRVPECGFKNLLHAFARSITGALVKEAPSSIFHDSKKAFKDPKDAHAECFCLRVLKIEKSSHIALGIMLISAKSACDKTGGSWSRRCTFSNSNDAFFMNLGSNLFRSSFCVNILRVLRCSYGSILSTSRLLPSSSS